MKNMWNQRYDVPEYVFGTEPNQFLREQVHHLQPGMTVLAVADGEGRNGVWLAQQGFNVWSVDASSVAQTKAKQLAAVRNVQLHFECADMLTWDWDKHRFDAIVAIFIQFTGAVDRERLFSAMKAALNPGGVLLLQGYTSRQLAYRTGGPSVLENLYTETIVRNMLSGLEIIQLREHDRDISEGAHHHGMSALIDVVAFKPQSAQPRVP
jgi:cyclopropane fatty-acyl-phospholipid synthase-like methyltransferase